MDESQIGPTGDFPQGKLNADDEGGLKTGIGRDDKGNVLIDFGKAVAWIAMPAAEAANFALVVLSHANARISVQIDDAMVARAEAFFQRDDTTHRQSDWIRALLEFAIHGQENV